MTGFVNDIRESPIDPGKHRRRFGPTLFEGGYERHDVTQRVAGVTEATFSRVFSIDLSETERITQSHVVS